MRLFDEEEKKLIEHMCPSCKDLNIILETLYNNEKYLLTREQIYNLNHACYDLEKLQVGNIVEKMCNNNIDYISDEFINCLNKGENCPVFNIIGKMGDYFKLVVNLLEKETENEFNFQEFAKKGNYSGIEYIDSTDEAYRIYQYIGNEEYLYYKVYIPYVCNYEFSYQTSILGSVSIQFFNKDFENISKSNTEIIEKGQYNEKELSIVKEESNIFIPYDKNSEIAYFMVGFKVENDSYFSNIILQKY